MKIRKRILIKIGVLLSCAALVMSCAALVINSLVVSSVRDKILEPERASELYAVDCVLVLGCLVKKNGEPSDMLRDRLDRGIELYAMSAAPKLLMSGDHGQRDYNEVGTMKRYAVELGVPSEDVFMDHAGFSTYDSLYRAKEVFGAKKIVIVTQKYHLYRALYIAEQLGIEAYGVASDYRGYTGQIKRDVREILARNKDFLSCAFSVRADILGEPIDLGGDGDVTNDY